MFVVPKWHHIWWVPGTSSPGIKQLRMKVITQPHRELKLWMWGVIPPLKSCLYGVVLNSFKIHNISIDYLQTANGTQNMKACSCLQINIGIWHIMPSTDRRSLLNWYQDHSFDCGNIKTNTTSQSDQLAACDGLHGGITIDVNSYWFIWRVPVIVIWARVVFWVLPLPIA